MVPNYDNDDEAWSVDDIGDLQVEVRGRPGVLRQDVDEDGFKKESWLEIIVICRFYLFHFYSK